ncbi:MAG: DsrE/DsrF/DrsH-like family protein [Betaproteobacteria bacterium]|nr:DsrE/DsrF/DrsH-like family protein [Betaproteobacteria bacterium]
MSITQLHSPETRPDAMPADLSSLEAWFDRRLDEKLAEREAARIPSLAIIATKGTMDMAYPPFILASTAAALGWNASIFFTFYGLELLKKDLDLKVSPLGNPAMPMKMPFGPHWLKHLNIPVPTLAAALPGFQGLATAMMTKTVKAKGVASIGELRVLCLEAGVRMVACQMTVDLFSYEKDEFIAEIEDWIGATSYLAEAKKADVCLFV